MKVIVTATGNDRPGIVSDLSNIITECGGNVEESRMIKLESEFSVIMLIAIKNNDHLHLLKKINSIEYLNIVIKDINIDNTTNLPKYDIKLHGADNEGIVAVLTKYLAAKSINIIEMNTHITQAPMTGAPLFNLSADITIPDNILQSDINNELLSISKKLGIDIALSKSS